MTVKDEFRKHLRTAMKARDLSASGRRELRRAILSALNRTPGRFLWAPKNGGATL